MTDTVAGPDTTSPLDDGARLSRDRIEALQLERLQATVTRAYELVPMYREKYDEAGVHPSDLKELDDLAKFPFTSKDDLRRTYPFGMFAVPQQEVARIHASSGTTGLPTVVGYTQQDLDDWALLGARCLAASGVKPGWKVHNAYGYGLFTGGLGAHAAAEKLGTTVIPMSGGQTDKQIQLIRDFEPDAILCTPTYLLNIGDTMLRNGLDPRATSLKVGVLGAEPWTEEMRAELEAMWDIDACDIYGLSEVMGPGVAGESVQTKDGNHVWEDFFRPEIIDPLETTVLPDGQTGELVFTALAKQALPIIRYRTHDLSVLNPGTAFPGHRRMGRISGRSDDMIILRGVNLFPTQVEEIALAVPGLSPHFQLELTRPHRMDELAVRIERREDCSADRALEAATELQKRIKVQIGSSCRVEVVDPGELPRSLGKLRRIHDLRDR